MRRTVDFLLRKSWRSRSSQCQRWSHYGKRAFSSNEFRAWGSDTSSSTLVLLRHGQSTWNKTPTFTGWCDVPLTNEGITEAKEAGQLMLDRNMGFDVAYTSELQRAKQTCYTTLGVIDDSVPVVEAWQLNERHYGALQGRPKDDPTLITEYGEDQLKSWRRDFDQRPPAMDPDHPYFQNPPAPVTGKSFFNCCPTLCNVIGLLSLTPNSRSSFQKSHWLIVKSELYNIGTIILCQSYRTVLVFFSSRMQTRSVH